MRTHNDYTQEAFGRLFDVTRDNIASYERGSQPRLDFIIRVATRFGLTLDELVDGQLEQAARSGEVRYDLPSAGPAVAAEPQAVYRAGGLQTIPIHELGKSETLSTLFSAPEGIEPIDRFAASILPRCDGGLRVRPGEGMAPDYLPGDIVFYRWVNALSDALVWGEAYLLSFELDGEEYTLVRILHRADQPGSIRLAGRELQHAPREIALSQIRALASIEGSVRMNLR